MAIPMLESSKIEKEREKKKHKKERDIKCSKPNNQVPFQLLLQIIRSEAATGIKNPKICHYGNGFSCNLLEKWKHPTKQRKQKRTQMRKRQKEAETRGAVFVEKLVSTQGGCNCKGLWKI